MSHYSGTMGKSCWPEDKRNTGRLSKNEMRLIIGTLIPILDDEQRWQNLKITTSPTLSMRLKKSNKLCGYTIKSLCRLVFLICYLSVIPVLVQSYTNS